MGRLDIERTIENAMRTMARPIVQESTMLRSMRQEVGRATTARDTALSAYERHADAAMVQAKIIRLPVPMQVTLMGLVDRMARMTVYEQLRHDLRPYLGQMVAPDQLLGEMACWWCGEQYQVAKENKHLQMRGRELARVYGMSESSISAVKKRTWAQMDHWLECALERMEWAMEGEE